MNLWNLGIPQRPFLITSYGSNNSASLGVAKPLTIRSEPTYYVVDLSLADFGLLGFSAGLGDPSPSRSTETRVDRTRAFTRRESTPLPELWSLEPWGGRVWDLASRFRVLKTHNNQRLLNASKQGYKSWSSSTLPTILNPSTSDPWAYPETPISLNFYTLNHARDPIRM